VDGVWTLWSETQIEGIVNGEHHLTLRCRDAGLTIHNDLLKTEVTEGLFPDAPEDSMGKFLPLAIGRVPIAELLPVTGEIAFTPLRNGYDAAPIIGPGASPLYIRIANSMGFTSADPRLVGKWIKVIRSGHEEVNYPVREIIS